MWRLGPRSIAGMYLLACSRGEPPEVEAAPAVIEVSQGLATPTAFDLAPALEGAVLAWAPQAGGQLMTQHFDAEGRALGTALEAGAPRAPAAAAEAAVVVGVDAADVSVVDSIGGLAVAWTEALGGAGQLRAAWLARGGGERSFELGVGWRGAPDSRGALALAARDRSALLLARGAALACANPADASCFSFRFFRVSAEAALPTGIALEVPDPCPAGSAQLVAPPPSADRDDGERVAAARYDYAICSAPAGVPRLTAFSIQPNPAYAAAEETLAGCTPLGAGRFAGEVAFVGRCGAGRRVARIPAVGGPPIVHDLDARGLVCGTAGTLLRFGADWLRLREPLGRLELLLNDDLAPAGARAVWAGAALLVAQAREGSVVLSRYVCRGSSLVQLDPPLLAR